MWGYTEREKYEKSGFIYIVKNIRLQSLSGVQNGDFMDPGGQEP